MIVKFRRNFRYTLPSVSGLFVALVFFVHSEYILNSTFLLPLFILTCKQAILPAFLMGIFVAWLLRKIDDLVQ